MALTLVATGPLLRADDPPASSDGYKIVPIHAGSKTVPFRVKDQPDALAHASFPDELDPRRAFSATNPLANKSFSLPSTSFLPGNSHLKSRDQDAFITKAYDDNEASPSSPHPDTHATFPTSAAASTRNAAGFDRSYPTSGVDAGQSRAAWFASVTSPDQNRTAALAAGTISTPVSPLADKTFQGTEAGALHRHLTRLDNGQMLVTELPNRPLTIDEVRDLINHGFKPNTDVKPEEPSKPLNDPNYKPVPLRDTPAPPEDDDANDPVPAPGTMSAPPAPPENSEPLPQP